MVCTRVAAARGRAGRARDALVDDVDRQALEHGHPLAQRGLEADLAAHGPLGDGGDLGLHADEVGEFVEALRPMMVESMSASNRRLRRPQRLHDEVDRLAASAARSALARRGVGLGVGEDHRRDIACAGPSGARRSGSAGGGALGAAPGRAGLGGGRRGSRRDRRA